MTTPLVDLQGPEARPFVQVRALAVACAVLLAAGVVGLFSVGADGQGPAKGDLAIVMAATDKTFAGTSARFTSTGVMSSKSAPSHHAGDIPMLSVQGQFDFARGRGTMAMTVSMVEVELRSTEKTAYVRLKGVPGAQSGTWYALDADEAMQDAEDNPLASLTGPSFGNPDPRVIFDALRKDGVVKRVSQTGHETIGTEQTTVYRIVLDGDVYKEMAVKQGNLPDEAADALQMEDVNLDLFITDAGLVLRNVFQFTVSVQSFSATLTMTTAYSDFGAPVTVEEPPAEQVVRVASIEEFKRLVGGGG